MRQANEQQHPYELKIARPSIRLQFEVMFQEAHIPVCFLRQPKKKKKTQFASPTHSTSEK
jgi:hypothetical protein